MKKTYICDKNIIHMTYIELLNTSEWREKCNRILKRDHHKCQCCGKLGYHHSSLYECKTKTEFDELFKGCTYNGTLFSDLFTEVCNKDSELKLNVHVAYIGEQFSYHCYKLSPSSLFGEALWGKYIRSNVYAFSKNMVEQFEEEGDHVIEVKLEGLTNLRELPNFEINFGDLFINKLEDVHFYKTNFIWSENYLVRIENIYPTLAFVGCKPIGNIVLSITHKNCCMTLFLKYSLQNPYLRSNTKDQKFAKGLNIHHKYYVKNKKPWDYEDDALVTLCEDCHKHIHLTSDIPV